MDAIKIAVVQPKYYKGNEDYVAVYINKFKPFWF